MHVGAIVVLYPIEILIPFVSLLLKNLQKEKSPRHHMPCHDVYEKNRQQVYSEIIPVEGDQERGRLHEISRNVSQNIRRFC